MKHLIITLAGIVGVAALACDFGEFEQSVNLKENIDDYRTGCVVDADTLLSDYIRHDQNESHYRGPTPTPRPARDHERLASIDLKHVWEHGCKTGMAEATNDDQASILWLRHLIEDLEHDVDDLEKQLATPVASPTPTPSKTAK